MMFPVAKVSRSLVFKIAVGEQLYFYNYPFVYCNSLVNYKNKHELLVKLEIIKVISCESIKKEFFVEEFIMGLDISNKKRTEVKRTIINVFEDLVKSKLIEPEFEIVYKKGSSPPEKVSILTPFLITKITSIRLYENL